MELQCFAFQSIIFDITFLKKQLVQEDDLRLLKSIGNLFDCNANKTSSFVDVAFYYC
jgi:hypothetical protein